MNLVSFTYKQKTTCNNITLTSITSNRMTKTPPNEQPSYII